MCWKTSVVCQILPVQWCLVIFQLFETFLSLPSVLWYCWLGVRKSTWPVNNLSGEVLVWLSVWSEVQMICIMNMVQLMPLSPCCLWFIMAAVWNRAGHYIFALCFLLLSFFMAPLHSRCGHYIFALWFLSFFMVALCNRADHYIFMLWFVLILLLLLFFSSPNLSRRRLDVCHTSTHGVALVRI